MNVIANGLAYAALIALAVGHIWVLVIAFQDEVVWGILSLFPPVWLIYVASNWKKCSRPFLIWLGGAALIVLVSALHKG